MRRYEIVQSEVATLTSHAGLALVGQALRHTRLDRDLGQVALRHGIAHVDCVKGYVGLLATGKSDFDAIENRRQDEFFRTSLGIAQVPSAPSLRQRFDDRAEAFIPHVDAATVDFVANVGAPVTPLVVKWGSSLRPQKQKFVALDIDVTPMDNSKTKKEGVGWTYKGFDGYAPIAAYLGQEGWCIGFELRPGSQNGQCEFKHFLERMLPRVPDAHRAPLLVPAQGARRGRVAFFSGCVMPELFGPVNAATIEVLARNGFEVAIPAGQGCCGALHRHSGDPEAADRLHARNREAFAADDFDALILNSAGCGAAMRDAGDALARKVRDVTEFLAEAGLRETPRALRLRVAYDDPCHLLHGQRVAAQPRALLRAIPGLELFDLPGCRDCCGAAGIYNLTQPEMSAKLLARKVQAIRDSAPQVLATGNPGCLLQIGAGVRAAGLSVEVLHPIELLARAYAR